MNEKKKLSNFYSSFFRAICESNDNVESMSSNILIIVADQIDSRMHIFIMYINAAQFFLSFSRPIGLEPEKKCLSASKKHDTKDRNNKIKHICTHKERVTGRTNTNQEKISTSNMCT